jgi:hypothetical protein
MFTTTTGDKINVVALTIDDTSDILNSLLPELANAIRSCDFTDCTTYKATYPFGSPIINNGKCYLSLDNGKSIALNDAELPDSLAQDLNYNPDSEDPLMVILTKNSELYQPSSDRIMSHAVLQPGNMLGIPRAIDFKNGQYTTSSLFWNLNAGSRSLFTLSRTTSKAMHSKLQKNCGVTLDVPLTSQEQWGIFKEIATYVKSPWSVEVLFFSRQFIEKLKDSKYAEVTNNLHQIRRASYTVLHNTSSIWDAIFNNIERVKRLTHHSLYSLFTARELFLIAANSAPGLKPATNEDSAPIKLLQDAYTNEYGLREENHSNVIMEPTNFTLSGTDAVYYSLNYPTLARYSPETHKSRSLITLLDSVERVTTIYQDNIPLSQPTDKLLCDVAAKTKFTFYHCNSDQQNYKNILSHNLIAEEDSRFTKDQLGNFAEHSAFFKGCVKIQHK